jgi:hypothetical protein
MKTEQIRIRCSEETRLRFKRVAANFKTYEEAIIAFIELYESHPYLFSKLKTGVRIR